VQSTACRRRASGRSRPTPSPPRSCTSTQQHSNRRGWSTVSPHTCSY
jgi:hypothetical protein